MIRSVSRTLKQQIESRLASRIPAALSPHIVENNKFLLLNNQTLNRSLGGGVPVGGICEFTGPVTAGKTSLALCLLREASVNSACAYIDVSDSLDARCAAAAGVKLQNLLWVRFPESEGQKPIQRRPQHTSSTSAVTPHRNYGSTQRCNGPHPRTETQGIDFALERMLLQKAESRLKKMVGTPGFANRTMSLDMVSSEQIAYDHFNARRPDDSDPLRQIDRKAADEARKRAHVPIVTQTALKKEAKPWGRLDKALRTADQILQAGGFRLIVLDLASLNPGEALRIPSATWYRFSRAAREGDAVLLLLTLEPCSGSSAQCVLHCLPQRFIGGHSSVLNGIINTIEVLRQRATNQNVKKASARAVELDSTAHWMRSAGS